MVYCQQTSVDVGHIFVAIGLPDQQQVFLTCSLIVLRVARHENHWFSQASLNRYFKLLNAKNKNDQYRVAPSNKIPTPFTIDVFQL